MGKGSIAEKPDVQSYSGECVHVRLDRRLCSTGSVALGTGLVARLGTRKRARVRSKGDGYQAKNREKPHGKQIGGSG
jgi:hypothetical protein